MGPFWLSSSIVARSFTRDGSVGQQDTTGFHIFLFYKVPYTFAAIRNQQSLPCRHESRVGGDTRETNAPLDAADKSNTSVRDSH